MEPVQVAHYMMKKSVLFCSVQGPEEKFHFQNNTGNKLSFGVFLKSPFCVAKPSSLVKGGLCLFFTP